MEFALINLERTVICNHERFQLRRKQLFDDATMQRRTGAFCAAGTRLSFRKFTQGGAPVGPQVGAPRIRPTWMAALTMCNPAGLFP
jgi:hypothetical protein